MKYRASHTINAFFQLRNYRLDGYRMPSLLLLSPLQFVFIACIDRVYSHKAWFFRRLYMWLCFIGDFGETCASNRVRTQHTHIYSTTTTTSMLKHYIYVMNFVGDNRRLHYGRINAFNIFICMSDKTSSTFRQEEHEHTYIHNQVLTQRWRHYITM